MKIILFQKTLSFAHSETELKLIIQLQMAIMAIFLRIKEII